MQPTCPCLRRALHSAPPGQTIARGGAMNARSGDSWRPDVERRLLDLVDEALERPVDSRDALLVEPEELAFDGDDDDNVGNADLRELVQAAFGTTYTIEHELAGGGMARVFVATEVALQPRAFDQLASRRLVRLGAGAPSTRSARLSLQSLG